MRLELVTATKKRKLFVDRPELQIETIVREEDNSIVAFKCKVGKKKEKEFKVRDYNITNAWQEMEKYIGNIKMEKKR
jgi:hypothetical protein